MSLTACSIPTLPAAFWGTATRTVRSVVSSSRKVLAWAYQHTTYITERTCGLNQRSLTLNGKENCLTLSPVPSLPLSPLTPHVCTGSLLKRRQSVIPLLIYHSVRVLAAALECVLPSWRQRWPWSISWRTSGLSEHQKHRHVAWCYPHVLTERKRDTLHHLFANPMFSGSTGIESWHHDVSKESIPAIWEQEVGQVNGGC